MATPAMPCRGDRAAPQFDSKQPRGLRRYFADLEAHFLRSNITDPALMKKHACSYVDIETSELWESIPQYTDATVTFDNFKVAIGALYPGSQEERKWSLADMDKLVGERSRLGVITVDDLGEYYRQFLAITNFLISKTRLSEQEQSRAFARGFQPELWNRISQRLQLKIPDHFPDDPYTLAELHEAAQYVLHGTSSNLRTDVFTSSSLPNPLPATTTQIKTEDLSAMFERMTETFMKALAMQHAHHSAPAERAPRTNTNPSAPILCNFCGLPDHFVRNCQLCEEYITAGKCKRNVEGKIVLPSGAFIPRDIVGKYMKDRFDEWHRRNPGQLAAATMMLNVLANEIASSHPTLATRATHPRLFEAQGDTPRGNPPKRLTEEDRIQSLERELFQLRTRGGDRRNGNREKPKGKEVTREVGGVEGRPIQTTPQPKKARFVPEVVIPVAPKPSAEVSGSAENASKEETVPEHPYTNVPDATYSAPTQRNFAAPPKPAPAKKAQPAYRNIAPIYDDKVAVAAFDKIMTSMITLTHGEVFSLSPELRSLAAEAISPRRRSTNESQLPHSEEQRDVHVLATDDAIARAIDDLEPDDSEYPNDEEPREIFINSIHQLSPPPAGATIVPDIYDLYLKSLPEGHATEPLIVAKESLALRSIFPVVNNQCEVEAILDPGSQIIAMSEDMCLDLALPYDPSVILTMQSANGAVDKSLGLARNVPICIGGITLYVQIHVIRSPAYDILLGRPFDTLTASVIQNFPNEDQTITILDPNSGQRATIPTTARGRPKRITQRQSFTVSRI